MGKIMSVLEKYKLIEKEGGLMPSPDDEEKGDFLYEEIPVIEEVLVQPKEEIHQAIKVTEKSVPTPKTVESSYNRTLTLDEVYNMSNLGDVAVTDTVFVLEGFINALPDELPEYVKKTTVDNILAASAMDLEKLLVDGKKRTDNLKSFINDYESQVTRDISELREEIAKLTAIISDYHQQIKHKEILLQEQSTLVKNETIRLSNILEFFNK